jgi:hypothetical protein
MGIRDSASNLNALKQRGLYVDIVDGRVTGPDEVPGGLAAAVIEAAKVCAKAVRAQASSAARDFGPGPLDGA